MMTESTALPPPAVFGGKLAALRKTAGLTQPELASLSGVSISSLYRAERSDSSVSAKTMARLALALAVEVGEIYRGDAVVLAYRPVSADRAEEQHVEVVGRLDRAAEQDLEVVEGIARIQSSLDKVVGLGSIQSRVTRLKPVRVVVARHSLARAADLRLLYPVTVCRPIGF